MDRSVWFSRRALKLHAVILVIVPAFAALCVWQIDRAVGGNSLSWAYVFEWPFFAGYAIYMWWRLVHEAPAGLPPEDAGRPPGGQDGTARPDHPTPHSDTTSTPGGTVDVAAVASTEVTAVEEDSELAAYNAYLAQLAERDRATRQGRGR